MDNVRSVRVPGPLGQYAEGFRDELARLGYTPLSAIVHMRLMARLSRWLAERALEADALTTATVETFFAERREAGYFNSRTPTSVRPLVAYLQGTGVVAPSVPAAPVSYTHLLRQSFTTTLSYTIPQREKDGRWRRLAGGWSANAILRARSGFPITVLESEEYTGITLTNAFRPLLLLGQPLWIGDSNTPGGRRLNPAAFLVLPSGQQGDLGRNSINGFGMAQLDMAVSRDFPIREKIALQFRVDAFNALNRCV